MKIDPQNTEDGFFKKKQQLLKKLKRRIKTAHKSLEKLKIQVKEAKNWQEYERRAIVLKSNLYQILQTDKRVTFTDWETNQDIVYILEKKPSEEVAAFFKKSKKLKAGVVPLVGQERKAEKWLVELEHAFNKLEETDSEEVLEEVTVHFHLEDKLPPSKFKPKLVLPYREHCSEKGIKIWVGKSAKDNDKLTFSYANGSDTWLHVNEFQGSHVVIRSENPDKDTLDMAIGLAIKNSKARNAGKVEVCITQVKYVSRYKQSKPGTVHISRHKKILAELD